MSTQGRPYQGYPYRNPTVFDAPSIDQATASKWTNLPRRPLIPNHGQGPSKKETYEQDLSENPVIYIELPESSTGQAESSYNTPQVSETELNSSPKAVHDPAEEPRVYIDIPDDCNTVSEPDYTQETILYDQFKDTRIEMPSSEYESSSSSGQPNHRPPTSLNLISPSSSGYSSQNILPTSMQKETNVYIRPTPDDDFSLSPIPVTEFPEPPPAYSEFDTRVQNTQSLASQDPPRTQVIGPNVPVLPPGSEDTGVKQLTCQHCGHSVTTIVELKAGLITHFLACFLLAICLLPCIPVIYLTSLCKYHNHYCPDCFQKIGYEVPITCQNIIYVKKE